MNVGAQPRPVSAPEREAVSLVAAFLERGSPALFARLTPDAPLRALPEKDAWRELDVRTGPRAGARWTLQTFEGDATDVAFRVTFPSGYEDGLLFRMRGDRVHEILTLAEVGRKPPPPARTNHAARLPMLFVAVALALAAVFAKRARTFFAILAAGALTIAIATQPSRPKTRAFEELRELAPLREALARGDEPPKDATHEIARLWLLQSGEPGALPGAAHSQLAELLRARIHLANDKKDEARASFARAMELGRRDDIALEAATSLESYPFPTSRDASFSYSRARQSSDVEEAHRELRIAWKLKPLPREQLVRDPRLSRLLHDVRTMSMISLLGAQEPLQRSAAFATKPLALPQNAKAFVCGEFLRITIGNASLDVPNGAALAPANAQLVAATHWTAEEDAAALRDAQSLLELPARATLPAARTRVVRAADALANHNRWRELLTVTNDITPQLESVSPELLVLRLRALLRAGRHDEARALANGEAVKALMQRNSYPATLISIADAIANIGDHERALQLYRAVQSEAHEQLVAARIAQLELRRALAASGTTIQTTNFDIRHDATMNPAIATRIGELLEAELARLQSKLPASSAQRRVTVNVLRWEDFRGNITRNDHILGLYDGEILFPFAVVQQFKPEVVSIITHELTHALVAQATNDNAPRWFQEGIAQRMELVPHHENAFYGRQPGVVLPVPLLDAVMENATDPYTMQHGYIVAHTFIRFLEAQYGERALATLIAEFAKGRNTDDALTTLTGKSADALNRDFRAWGFANNGNFTSTEPWPYAHLYSPGVDPRIREGFTWGKRPPQ